MLLPFDAKAQGASHKESGLPCQDAARACVLPPKLAGIVCVADGHGSEKHTRSDKGSAFAVNVCEKSLREFYGIIADSSTAFFNRKINVEQRDREIKEKLSQLKGSIIHRWHERIEEDLYANFLNDTEKDICKKYSIDASNTGSLAVLYGTTVLAALVTKEFWFALQLGDGICVTLDKDGRAGDPIQKDDRLGFGRTSSLCEPNAVENFRHAYGFDMIKGITLATDGVADSFEQEKYFVFIEGLYEKFTNAPEKAKAELAAFLPELSERGSRDDCAIAGVWRAENTNKGKL
jgi:serine/threonine protein phosphatase PrpC